MINTRLQDKVVLVTGGAGGIGAAISRAFAAQGAKVAIGYLPQDVPAPGDSGWEHITPELAQVEELTSELEGSVAVPVDLARPESAAELFDAVTAALGPVDVLVNNAAHAENPDDVSAVGHAGWERTFRVNAFAPAALTAELVRRTPKDTPSCVVNISTDAARAFPGQLAYGSSKAALEAFTRGVALDVAADGIRVNAVAPGPVQTGWIPDEQVETVKSIIPMGTLGAPDDIADAVVFLASHQARWITGQVLQVAGGHAL